MNDNDRFAGLGVSALSMTERESVVELARTILASELHCGPLIAGERAATAHLQLKSARYEREVFGCLFLTARHRLIRDEELFYGSVDRTAVYPRVILQKALKYNAAGLIMWSYCQIWCTEGWSCDGPAVLGDLDTVVELHALDHLAELMEAA